MNRSEATAASRRAGLFVGASPYLDKQTERPAGMPVSHLGWAIVCVAVLFFPFGIPAVCYAAAVERHCRAGRWVEATHASRWARIWCIAATVAGGVIWLAVAIYIFVLVAVIVALGT